MESQQQTPQQVFAWRLDPKQAKQSIYLKQKCIERIDINKVYGFINEKMGIDYADKRHNGFESELKQITNYKCRYSKKVSGFMIQHVLAKHKWGRLTTKGYSSISTFHRPTRHAFCEDEYKDLDMKNAAPTMITQIALHHDIKCPNLEKYCGDPAKYKTKIMEHHKCSKDVAKNLVISIMYGGKYSSWLTKNDINYNDNNPLKIVSGIQDECSVIMEIVYANNEKIKKDVMKADPTKWKSESEKKRGVMALWGQTIERFIQEAAIAYLVEEQNMTLINIVPSQDGFMIPKDLWYEGICDDLNTEIKRLYNIEMTWVDKPFDERIEIPSFSDTKTYGEWDDEISAKRLGDKFIEEFGDVVVRNKSCIYIYWGEKDENGNIINGRWYDETDKNRRYKLMRYISEDLHAIVKTDILNAIELDEEKEIPKLLKSLRNHTSQGFCYNDIMKHIFSKARSTEVEFDSDPFLLGFENGVYDLNEDTFRGYTFNDYITISTNYDYTPLDSSPSTKLKVKEFDDMLKSIHPNEEHRLLFLQVLASGLDGRAYQKLFLFNGAGGNGKGLTGALMEIVLGSYYLQPSNGILKDVEKSNAPSPDMYNLKNKRYINFKEVAGSIRVAMMRNLTGGGKFCGRLLNQNPEHFFMAATFVMEFNTSPDFDGKPQRADYRRLVDLLFPVNFTDDDAKIGKTIGGVKYAEANTYYETQQFLSENRNIFLHLLLRVYRTYKDPDGAKGMIFSVPEDIKKRTEEFIENQNLFQKVFNDLYEKVEIVPDNKEDEKRKTLKLKDIFSDITYSDEYKALSYKDRRIYNSKAFDLWICESFTISGNSKSGKLIKGVRRKEVEDDVSDTETEALFGTCNVAM